MFNWLKKTFLLLVFTFIAVGLVGNNGAALAQQGRMREKIKQILQERKAGRGSDEWSQESDSGISYSGMQGLDSETRNKLQSYSVDTPEIKIQVLTMDGGRVDWSQSGNNRIAFDRIGQDGYSDVWTMNADGSDQQCITCENQGELPQKHNGNPAWHPSGKYIVFQAEKQSIPDEYDIHARPGAGGGNDLWVVREGEKFYKIVNVPDDPRQLEGTQGKPGVLHPHFSHDGKKLFWAERIGKGTITRPKSLYGKWVLKIADFLELPQPHLENIKTYHPGEQWDYYEGHDFSRDDTKVLFSANMEQGQPSWGLDEYEMSLTSKAVRNLTNTMYDWEEHANYALDDREIVWMSTKGNDWRKYFFSTDFWIMNSNGSNQRRLTHFNEPGYPDFIRKGTSAADISFSPDGRQIAALISFFKKTQAGVDTDGIIVLITLKKSK